MVHFSSTLSGDPCLCRDIQVLSIPKLERDMCSFLENESGVPLRETANKVLVKCGVDDSKQEVKEHVEEVERIRRAAMFSGRFCLLKTFDNCYFIDCNGVCFGRVLDWLRSGTVDISGLATIEIELLLHEARYFQISSLVFELEHVLEEMQRLQAQKEGPERRSKFSQKELVAILNSAHHGRPVQLASCNLSDLDLSGISVSETCLMHSGLDLSEANLQFACLKGATLRSSSLQHANL